MRLGGLSTTKVLAYFTQDGSCSDCRHRLVLPGGKSFYSHTSLQQRPAAHRRSLPNRTTLYTIKDSRHIRYPRWLYPSWWTARLMAVPRIASVRLPSHRNRSGRAIPREQTCRAETEQASRLDHTSEAQFREALALAEAGHRFAAVACPDRDYFPFIQVSISNGGK